MSETKNKVSLDEVELEVFPDQQPRHRRSKYTEERKAEILVAIENEYGGNVRAACAALGIPVHTVRSWYSPVRRGPTSKKVLFDGERIEPMPKLPSQEIIDQKRYHLTDIFESIVAKYAQYIDAADLEELKTKPNVAAVTLGILFDKLQIMKGQPTHITQTNVRYMEQGSLRNMARERLKVLEGGKGGPDEDKSSTA